MAKSKTEFFTITIFDDSWNIYKLPESDNVLLDDEDAEAEIDYFNKEIHFKRSDLDSVAHELWHLFKHYTFTENANLTATQEEEVSATIWERRRYHMIKLSEDIHAKLKAL
jgi:hypothetical protein